MQRRLAAVLAADVVGYSRLMAQRRCFPGKANRFPDRHQHRRYHHRRRRYLWRWGQYCGAPGNAVRARRLMYFKGSKRPNQGQALRQMFTSQFIPDATKEQADWFNEFQRLSSSPTDAARNLQANGDADVSSLLSQVKVPTLVMHARHDARVPFESGRRMAAGIPAARFVPLESRNHVILEGEPAFGRFLEELRSFLGADVRH